LHSKTRGDCAHAADVKILQNDSVTIPQSLSIRLTTVHFAGASFLIKLSFNLTR